MEQCSALHHLFFVETQQVFHKHIDIGHHRKLPCHNTLYLWLENFRMSAFTLKVKPSGNAAQCRIVVEH